MADIRRFVRSAEGTICGLVCLAGLASFASAEDRSPAAAATGVRVEGAAAPGSRVRLQVDDPQQRGRHYLWFQTGGPPVEMSSRTESELKVTIPSGADELDFLVIVSDERGMREATVSIPVASSPPSAAEELASGGHGGIRADAGDDQVGLVGRRITLNGSASTPHEGLSYRWIQVDGPAMGSPTEDGKFLSFIPRAPGQYRFGLVVAAGGQISKPDYVNVDVGLPLRSVASTTPAPTAVASQAAPAQAGLDALVASGLSALDDAPLVVGPLAEAFQATATRMDLYSNYAELYAELTRRLDGIVPKDPARCARWNVALFEPLTRHVVAQLLPLGLDLRTPQGHLRP